MLLLFINFLLLTFSIHAMESESKVIDLETRKQKFLEFQRSHPQEQLIPQDLINQSFANEGFTIRQTMLTQAIYQLRTRHAIEPFIQQGADVNESGSIRCLHRDSNVDNRFFFSLNCSPLWLAIKYAPEIVPLLLEKKAQLNEDEKKGAIFWELSEYEIGEGTTKTRVATDSLEEAFALQASIRNIQLFIRGGAYLDFFYGNFLSTLKRISSYRDRTERYSALSIPLLLAGLVVPEVQKYNIPNQSKLKTLIEQIPAIQESYQKANESYLGQLPKDLKDSLIHFVVERINTENQEKI